MGVYIKGMEMPESCYYCPFRQGSFGKFPIHRAMCMVTGEVMPVDEENIQHDQPCPLVYVPPHGRLIDESAIDLSKYEKAAHDALHNGKGSILYDSGVLAGARAITRLVRNAPTILEAEEGE